MALSFGIRTCFTQSSNYSHSSPLAKIVDGLFLKGYLHRFLARRHEVLKRLAESREWSLYLQPSQANHNM